MYGYYITQKGADLMAQALLDESKVTITQCAVGDGGDAEAEKDLSRTALNNETYRKSFDIEDSYALAPDDSDTLLIECVFPSEAGELSVSEIGFFDNSDTLIAYGVLKEQKLNTAEAGLEYSLDIVSFIELTSEQLSVLKVDLGKANVQAISERVDEFESTVNSTVDQYKTDLNNSWNEHVQEYETKVDGKIKGIEDTLESLNLSGDMKERLETLEQSVEKYHPALDNKVSALETTTEDLSSDVGTLQTTVGNHSTSISSLQTTTGDLSDSVGTLETTVTDLNDKIEALEAVNEKAYLCVGTTFLDKLRSIGYSTAYSTAQSIMFTKDSPTKDKVLTDVSRDGDNSVVAWIDATTIFISAYGKRMMANPDSQWMLSQFGGTSIDISNLDTSEVTNMECMFYQDTNLTSLNLSNINTSNVTNMKHMFASIKNLPTLDLSLLDTSKVTTMEAMFSESNFTSLDFSGWDTSNVTDMGNMFSSCEQLKSLDLSCLNVSKLEIMSYMFYHCSAKYIDLSGWDAPMVEYTHFAFKECYATAVIGSLSFPNVYSAAEMFRESNIIYADLSNFKTSKCHSFDKMFQDCSLPYINVSSFDLSKADEVYSMFNSRNIKKIYCDSDWTSNSTVANSSSMFSTSLPESKGFRGSYAKPKASGGNFTPLTTTEERLNYLEYLMKVKTTFS